MDLDESHRHRFATLFVESKCCGLVFVGLNVLILNVTCLEFRNDLVLPLETLLISFTFSIMMEFGIEV